MFALHAGKHSLTLGCHSVDSLPQRFPEMRVVDFHIMFGQL